MPPIVFLERSARTSSSPRSRTYPHTQLWLLLLQLSPLLDFETAAARQLGRRRQGHLQHSVVERGFRLIRDRAFGQRNRAAEAPVRPFGAIDPVTLGLLLLAALS